MDETTADRFWSKVEKTDGCWEWAGAKQRAGSYGRFRIGDRVELAHRIAWSEANGAVADGMDICHVCDNPPCVRPDHLFAGSRHDNMMDASRKGRIHRAQKSTCVRGHDLTADNARRKDSGCAECHRIRNKAWMSRYRTAEQGRE